MLGIKLFTIHNDVSHSPRVFVEIRVEKPGTLLKNEVSKLNKNNIYQSLTSWYSVDFKNNFIVGSNASKNTKCEGQVYV